MKKVTIKDIAREAGVSPGAVSLVLNNQPCRISQETRQLILATAQKHHYQPNSIARSMVTKKTKTLGVIIPDIENIFFSSLVKNLEFHCHQRGYMLLTVNSDDRAQREWELLDMLSARQIDGLFLVPSNETFDRREDALRRLNALNIPLVLLDRTLPELACDQVSFDNRQGTYEAVCHLISLGHTRIGCITAPFAQSSGKARLAGYLDAMAEHNLPVDDRFLCPGDYRLQSGYDAAAALVPHTTAVFSGNDMMALGFLKYLGEQGLSVPSDYSVVGYDDVVNSYLINLELTSVTQDVAQISAEAARLMLCRLDGETHPPEHISLVPSLTPRQSTAPLSSQASPPSS